MSKRRIDIDDDVLDTAKAVLGTTTVSDTVNAALRQITGSRTEAVRQALDVLAECSLVHRSHAWR